MPFAGSWFWCASDGHVSNTGREFADALERMPRGEDHGKKRPAELHLPCQINSAHAGAAGNKGLQRLIRAHVCGYRNTPEFL